MEKVIQQIMQKTFMMKLKKIQIKLNMKTLDLLYLVLEILNMKIIIQWEKIQMQY